MAKVIGTIEAQFSGRVGDKVYYKHQDITCVRKAPTVKSDSRTPRQLVNQQRFKQIHLFCRQFLATPVLRTWMDVAVNMPGYTLFVKANAPAFTAFCFYFSHPLGLKYYPVRHAVQLLEGCGRDFTSG